MDGFSLREAPSYVVRGLQSLSDGAALPYLGDGQWLLCLYKPSSERRQQAGAILGRLEQSARSGLPQRELAAVRQRYRFAQLVYDGYQVVDTYEVQGSPDSSIVLDYERALWLLRHQSEQEQLAHLLDPNAAERDAARRDLTDPARARDAWRTAFTRQHAVHATVDPTGIRRRLPSGWVHHTPAHAA